jgi:hypothetical protein
MKLALELARPDVGRAEVDARASACSPRSTAPRVHHQPGGTLMTTQQPKDPDELTCPRCGALPGGVCRQPNGRVSVRIHMMRRRASQATEPNDKPTSAVRRSPGTPEGRRKGQAAQVAARRRRQSELAAATAARREAAEEAALEAEAQALIEDASRYTRDRLLVRRLILDAAQLAGERLVEGLEYMLRPRAFDQEGTPATKPTELYRVSRAGVRTRFENADGTPATEERPDLVGYYTVDQLEALAKVAATALNSLRLEEGRPTGILENKNGGISRTEEILGKLGVAELIAFAAETLMDPDDQP